MSVCKDYKASTIKKISVKSTLIIPTHNHFHQIKYKATRTTAVQWIKALKYVGIKKAYG